MIYNDRMLLIINKVILLFSLSVVEIVCGNMLRKRNFLNLYLLDAYESEYSVSFMHS